MRVRWGNLFVALLILGAFVYGGAVLSGVTQPPQLAEWLGRLPRGSIVQSEPGSPADAAPTSTPQPATRPQSSPPPSQPGGRADTAIRSEVPVPESQGNFRLGYITVAFDKEFPPYALVVLLHTERLAEQRGLGVRFIPFDIEDKNRFAEWRRAELLQNGGFDVMFVTMETFSLWGHPDLGKVTAIVGESAGADKAVVERGVRTFNDLAGSAIAYSDSSVSEYLLYYMLRTAGVPVDRVIRFGHENLNQAVRRFMAHEANGVVGWTSSDLEEALRRPEAQVLMSSDKFRVTVDVIVAGNRALATRREALQVFHDAWFDALKLTIEQPDRAAAGMARWSSKWTGVNTTQDLRDALSEFAQATLADNQAVFSDANLPLLYTRFKQAQSVWRAGGRQVARVLRDDELPAMFEPAFVRRTAQTPAVLSNRPPVNPTFHLVAQPPVPRLSTEELGRAPTVAVLGVEQVVFEESSAQLSAAARADIEEFVVPVLRNTRGTYLKVEASASWPAGRGLSDQAVTALALDRARAVQDYIIKFGIAPDRLVLGTVLPRCRECRDPAEMQKDDLVTFTLIAP